MEEIVGHMPLLKLAEADERLHRWVAGHVALVDVASTLGGRVYAEEVYYDRSTQKSALAGRPNEGD